MIEYPSIPYWSGQVLPSYIFDKLDGSSVRAEWSRKRGFYKFGRRHGLLDDQCPALKPAPQLFLDTYSEPLAKVFVDYRWQSAVVFFEYWSPNSFAGYHLDEPHDVTLFDVAHPDDGMLPPQMFLKLFGHLSTARLLYHGNINHELEDRVFKSLLPDMTFEGVVCKAAGKRGPIMYKMKSKLWLDRLKARCLEIDPDPEGADRIYKKLM